MNQPDRTIRLYHPLGGTGASSRAARKAGGARVSALPYLYRPLGKRSFGTNPDGEAKGASPRGGLVGCNKRWYGAEDRWRFLALRGDRARPRLDLQPDRFSQDQPCYEFTEKARRNVSFAENKTS
jgi:hypothetical protein